MKTLSIRQPWAWAIIKAGKDFENRDWPTIYRGPLLIHAAKTFEFDGLQSLEGITAVPIPEVADFQRGGIVGIVDLVDCIEATDEMLEKHRPWLFGPYGFKLVNPRPLPFHPCKGKLRLFEENHPQISEASEQ